MGKSVGIFLKSCFLSAKNSVSDARLIRVATRFSGLLAKYLCLPELAQETYSTTPVGAVSNRTGTQHLPYILSETTI